MSSFFFGGGFGILFSLVFAIVFAMILIAVIKSIQQWNRNNRAPRLTVDAVVVAKRTAVSHHHDAAGGIHTASSTYYVTFEVESGDRMEFHVSSREYAMLAEQDAGRLQFQGTRYLFFERNTQQK